MPLSKQIPAAKAFFLYVILISLAKHAVAAPVADVGTAVSSAPDPRPNEDYISDLIIEPDETNKELKKRGVRTVPIGSINTTATLSPENAPNISEETADKALKKRQVTRLRSVSAPSRLSGLANPIVEETVQEIPSSTTDWDYSYVWPSSGPVQQFGAWPSSPAVIGNVLEPKAIIPNQGFQVLDGLGNPIVNDALQPEAVVPGWVNGAEQYYDPNLFDEPVQILDGLGNPIQNDALQPEAVVPGFQNGPEQYFDPNLFNEPEPVQILNGLSNPIVDDALQPVAVVPGFQNGPEQYFDPGLFDSQPLQVLDGLGNPIVNDALQPEAVVPNWVNGPEQYFDPALFEPDQPVQILDGLGNPIRDNALQPEAVVPVAPGLVEPVQPIRILDGLGNPIRDNALQPEVVVPAPIYQNGPEQYFDPGLFDQPNQPIRVSDGIGNLIQNDALQLQQSDLINTGPAIADLVESDPIELADVFQQINDFQMPDPVVRLNTGGRIQDVVPISADTRPFAPNALDVAPLDRLLSNDIPVTNIAPVLPQSLDPTFNIPRDYGDTVVRLSDGILDSIDPIPDPIVRLNYGFNNAAIMPNTLVRLNDGIPDSIDPFPDPIVRLNGGIADNVSPYLLPDLPGVNQNFDGTLANPTQVNNFAADLNDNLLGANPLLNGGAFTFSCVPVYVDPSGVQRPFTDILAQALRSLNVNVANYDGITDIPDVLETVQENADGLDTVYTDSNKDAELDPFLREVVDSRDDIVTAKKVDANTVYFNTDDSNDAEGIVTNFDNGWQMTATDTGGANTFDTVTLERGDTKFDISNPSGFDSASLVAANTPGEILNGALRGDATVAVDNTGPLKGGEDVTVINP
ncbi:hypothetical protein TWF694_009888 [Orbilia ellipsospora]|uniref:Uncharacterized protein n=1 Tax=Orbilia ellipsospora TaxID=2528407 RepID=A0AAV9XEX9_9PEZI